MTFYAYELGESQMQELLQEAAARTGFTAAEMEDLLESELTVDQLLEYITAFVSNRMN